MRLALFLCAVAGAAVMFAEDEKAELISEQRYVLSWSAAEHLVLLLKFERLRDTTFRMEPEPGTPNVGLVLSAPQHIHDGLSPFVEMLNAEAKAKREEELRLRHERALVPVKKPNAARK